MDVLKRHELEQFSSYLEKRLGEKSVKMYVYALGRWFNTMNGAVLVPQAAQEYIDSLGERLAPSTVGWHAHAIMRYFRWKGIHVKLDCPTVRLKEPEYLSVDDVKRVINSCRTLLEMVLVVVLFDTAVRISELLNLKMHDIDWDSGFLTVRRKGGRVNLVNISPKALTVLMEWVNKRIVKPNDPAGEYVLLGLGYQDAWRMIRKVGVRAKINVHPHVFRHSRAIQLLMEDVELNVVKDHLGHVNIATTANIYGRLKAVDVKKKLKDW